MTHRIARGAARWLVAVALLSLTGGCWWLRPAVPQWDDPPGSRIAGWHLGRIGVVPFADATRQGVGPRVFAQFSGALARRLGQARVVGLQVQPADVGFVGVGQAQRLGRTAGVDALVAGQVLAYSFQRRQARTLVTVALRLLDANRGSIIWSRSATGTASVRTSGPLDDAGFDEATNQAAKEFIDDLLATPAQARVPRGPAVRRGHGAA